VAYLQANAEEIWLEALHIRASQEEREIGAMTDQELQRLEHDTLDELGGVMYRAALLRTRMTDDEYLKQGDQQLMYEQLFGAVASLCMSGYTPDDIVPALIRHAVELAVMEDVTAAVAEDAAALINILNFRFNDHKAERAEESVTVGV
jgi:hypothetical protein